MRTAFLYLLGIILVIACAAVQVTFIQSYDRLSILIHIPLLLGVMLMYMRLHTRAYVVAFIGAILFDIYSVLPFGVYVASVGITLAVQAFIQQRMLKQQAFHAITIIVFVTSLVYAGTTHALAGLVNRASPLVLQMPELSHVFGSALTLSGVHLLIIGLCSIVLRELNKRYSFRHSLTI